MKQTGGLWTVVRASQVSHAISASHKLCASVSQWLSLSYTRETYEQLPFTEHLLCVTTSKITQRGFVRIK